MKTHRPPLDGVREAPFTLVRSTDDVEGDGLTLDGWGSVFNRRTVINSSYEGRFQEEFAPGSMRRSFRETPPKIQFDHGRHPLIGSIPIAALRSVEEAVDPVHAPEGGAHIVARIFDNWLMQPVRDAIAEQAIDGMSHRFAAVRESWTTADGKPIRDERTLLNELERAIRDDVPDDELPVRTIKEARIMEMGPVVWPAYTQTSVGVRSTVIDLGALRSGDPEQRKLLAEAVFIADAASNVEPAQRDASDIEPPAVERPETKNDAQRSTSDEKSPVGEHPSTPRGRRAIDLMLRRSRDNLLTIKKEGKKL